MSLGIFPTKAPFLLAWESNSKYVKGQQENGIELVSSYVKKNSWEA